MEIKTVKLQFNRSPIEDFGDDEKEVTLYLNHYSNNYYMFKLDTCPSPNTIHPLFKGDFS